MRDASGLSGATGLSGVLGWERCDRVCVVDGPLDQVGDGDIEVAREGVEVDLVVFLEVIVFEVVVVEVVAISKHIEWSSSFGGGIDALGFEFGEGCENGVEREAGVGGRVRAHAQVLRRDRHCAKGSTRGFAHTRAQTWYARTWA